MSKTFAEFSLHETLQQALEGLGFTSPTPVQEQAIPAALDGKDLLVSSQTGSGKTAAFLLPTLNALAGQETFVPFKERMKAVTQPSILVLCPTRELAQQVSQDAIAFVRHMKGVRIAAIMGGMPFGKQIQQLKGAQVIVATPGRLLDLVNRRQLKLDKVESLIVDEADRMLDLGFSEDLEAIGELAANRNQTLMFSATFADRIIRLAERMMNDPQRIAIETGHSTNTDVTQTLHWTDGFEHKKKLLTHWLSDESVDQAVVFASTQEDTDMLAEELAEAGHSVVALHGAMPQTVRNRRLRSIREGRAKILVATDVAARGLDVPTISHVINFGLPMKNEDYVHRIGRTGRAGRTGQAITLATYRERGKIRALEDYLDARLNVSEIEGLEPSPPPARSGRDVMAVVVVVAVVMAVVVVLVVVVVLKARAISNVVKAVMIVHVVASMINHVVSVHHSVVKIVHVASLTLTVHVVKVVLKTVHVVTLMINHVVNVHHSVVKIVHVASSIQIAHVVKVVLKIVQSVVLVVKIVHVASSIQIAHVVKVVSMINRVLTRMMTTVVTV
jgi:superfamily II DNA/RNA helicase